MVTLGGGGLEGAESLGIGLMGLKRLMLGTLYGDLLQRLSFHVRAYEAVPGSAGKLLEEWTERAKAAVAKGSARAFAADAKAMTKAFLALPMRREDRPKVGIVGEILLKYHPQANLNLVEEIIEEGGEPVLGDMASFFLYCLYDSIYRAKEMGGEKSKALGAWLAIRWFEHLRGELREALEGTPLAGVPTLAEDLKRIDGVVSAGQEAGEGWLLTAEMMEFLDEGVPNVVCLQPFGCLPNHVTGKGVMRRLRETYPDANLCAIDFEAGTSKTNVMNRLKLFLAQAREQFKAGRCSAQMPQEEGEALGEVCRRRVIPIHPSANAGKEAPGASSIARDSPSAG